MICSGRGLGHSVQGIFFWKGNIKKKNLFVVTQLQLSPFFLTSGRQGVLPSF